MKRHLFVWALLVVGAHSFAQPVFYSEYSTAGTSDEGGGIFPTSEGGFIVGGTRFDAGVYDFVLIKTNSAGVVQWANKYDAGASDKMYHVRQTNDGGYCFYGSDGNDLILAKTDASGAPQWAQRISAASTTFTPAKFREVAVNANRGYILSGTVSGLGSGSTDGFLIRTAADGTVRWADAIGTASIEVLNDVQEDANGNWSACGYAGSAGNEDGFWVLLDSVGNGGTLFRKYNVAGNGTAGAYDMFYSSALDADGEYILAGKLQRNIYIAKVRNNGSAAFVKRYTKQVTITGPVTTFLQECYSVDMVSGGGAFWFTGRITGGIAVDETAAERDFLLAKVNITTASTYTSTIASVVAIGKTPSDEFPLWGKMVSANEAVAIGTNATSGKIVVVKGSTNGNCDYHNYTPDATITNIATGTVTNNSSAITNIFGSLTVTDISGGFSSVNIGGSTSLTQDCLTILPVSLLSFSGNEENSSVKLFWSTASEENNDYFTIERSTDGKTFSEIGRVNGGGNSNAVQRYGLTDESPAKQNYYRLSQTDFNGQRTDLGMVAVKLSHQEALSLLLQSNPVATNGLSLSMYSSSDQEVELRITDLRGRTLRLENTKLKKNETRFISIDLAGVSNGAYFLSATTRNSSVNRKFLLLNRE